VGFSVPDRTSNGLTSKRGAQSRGVRALSQRSDHRMSLQPVFWM